VADASFWGVAIRCVDVRNGFEAAAFSAADSAWRSAGSGQR
jgi:hypothetical protein